MGQLCTNLGLNKESKPTLLDLLGVCPQLLLYVYGDSSDGGTTPDATAQASIDGLRALGVPAANIKWTYIVDKNLTVAAITTASTIGNIVLTIDKDLVIADATTASAIAEITLALAGGLLVVAELSTSSSIDLITLTQN